MSTIEHRLAALEKSNTRYRLLALGLLAFLAYTVITSFDGKQVPDILQAKKFELADGKGNVLVRLDNFEGYGAVTTYTPQGNILTDIVATKSNAGGIVVYDGKGKQHTIVTDVTGGGGSIRLLNKEQQTAVSMGRNTMNGGSITVNNFNAASAVQITCDTEGNGAILTF